MTINEPTLFLVLIILLIIIAIIWIVRNLR